MPVYGGVGQVDINVVRFIEMGDSANVFRITFENHWGTHVDAPNHFFCHGAKICQYPASFWIFDSPQIISVELKPAEVIGYGKWLDVLAKNTDLLLFRSNWSEFRKSTTYYTDNPGLSPEIGFYLRKHYPSLRAIGIDWISISSYCHREVGRQAHRAFLDPDGEGKPIILIEDMNIPTHTTSLREVRVFPLIIEGIDSAPCTIIGEFR